MIYADSSFLIALYLFEPESEVAQRYMGQVGQGLIYTPFHRLEMRTALRVRVYRRDITLERLKSIFRDMDDDLRTQILIHVSIDWDDALREAESIGAEHVVRTGARSGELFHVASAVALGASEFCTFDRRQTELAKRAGLNVRKWAP